jgi:hypothetical protein
MRKEELATTDITVNGQEWLGIEKVNGNSGYWYAVLANYNEEELQTQVFIVKADP